jgi:hypothetical protein
VGKEDEREYERWGGGRDKVEEGIELPGLTNRSKGVQKDRLSWDGFSRYMVGY